MDKVAITGAQLVDPEGGAPVEQVLLLESGRIRARVAPHEPLGEGWRRVPRPGCRVAPGFIDLHFHGELVVAGPGAFGACLERASASLARTGTTAFLATTLAWSHADLPPRLEALVARIEAGGLPGAECLGLHLEGPWLSPEAPGAMSLECIRPFDPAGDVPLLDRTGAWLRMVTLAPEAPGAHALLAELAARSVLAAIGHTRASAAEIDEAVARGARHATHLFNAMGPIHHRAPGVAAELMARDALHCDLICDGHHVHPTMVRLAARALGERLVLISDRVDHRTPDARGPAPDDDCAPVRLPDGTLAGSQLSLDRAVDRVRAFAGLSLVEAVAACTLRPARLLGLESQRGTLRPGARADLAVLEADGRVRETWIAGRCAAADAVS